VYLVRMTLLLAICVSVVLLLPTAALLWWDHHRECARARERWALEDKASESQRLMGGRRLTAPRGGTGGAP
jgi:uncharacterized iron-regulated membrane protein